MTGYRLENDQATPWRLVDFNEGSARVCVCAWNVDGHYKSASVVVIRAGGWWVGACGHWCCLAASHHAFSPSLSCSTAVARPPFPDTGSSSGLINHCQKSANSFSPPHLTSLLIFTGLPRWVYDIGISRYEL